MKKKNYIYKVKGKGDKHLGTFFHVTKQNELDVYAKGLLDGVKLFRYDVTIEVYESVDDKEVLICKFR